MAQNILIIKLGAIGDVIRTTSIIPGLKRKYPNSEIFWATRRQSYDVLKNNAEIKKVFLIGDAEITNLKYDIVISLDDESPACELASSVIRDKIIGAYLEDSRRTYTDDSALWFDMGLISKFGKAKADELKAKNKMTYQEIMYNILDLKYKKQEPILVLNDDEINFCKGLAFRSGIKKTDLAIGINTGAGGRWEDKKLSVGKTAELIDKVSKEIKNSKVILFGGPEEKERNRAIKEKVKSKIIDAGCDNSLIEFASLVNLCEVLVTSDSLALHIGVALKKKIVVFFYVTSDSEIELYDRGIKIIGKGKDYCSYKTKCDYPPKWDIDEIVSAVKRLAISY